MNRGKFVVGGLALAAGQRVGRRGRVRPADPDDLSLCARRQRRHAVPAVGELLPGDA